MKLVTVLALMSALSTAQAAKIAVIDSGLDYKHDMIKTNLWTNANEIEDRRDNDGNGYQDDVHGWNFAEQNGMIIDYKYLGTFSADCKKYFDIQGKYFLNQASAADIAWIKEKQADKKFITELGKFGNFVHGTHVAGITVRGSKSEAMGVKLIPTEIKPFITGLQGKEVAAADKWETLAKAFTALATQQMTMLTEIATFVGSHKMDVANGSFGTGFKQGKMIGDLAYRAIFLKKPTPEDSDRAAGLFIAALVAEGSKFVAAAPNTLFVFAAGNDGMSNDKYGTSPANIKADNVITVGATYKNEFFAPFSNYGTKMVDIAAPGMLIDSAIPGNDTLKVSGTSQAAPYVANVAAQIKEANPALKPVEIKKILMGTVDMKTFLAEKISTSGIVNIERAVVAAQISRTVSVTEAIARAKTSVRDMPTAQSGVIDYNKVAPMPMPSMFR